MTQNFNISFIIIGRNEGCKLKKCFQSVFKAIEDNNLVQSDVIYVDSKSVDNSTDVANSFNSVRIYGITGDCNAAIARNIGANESKGDLLFFIDGDMEIEPSFLSHVFSNKHEIKSNCLTGHLDDYLYTTNGEFIERKKRTYKVNLPEKNKIVQMNGGVFLISKKNWTKIDGMKTKYRRSQDLDFFLRLSNIGIKILRIPQLIVKHHTVDYRNKERMWKDFLNGNFFYDSLIFRDHFFSFASWKRTIRSKYTSIILLVSIIALIFDFEAFSYLILLYLAIVTIRVCINAFNVSTKGLKLIYVLNRFVYQVLNDISFWIGVALFWPVSKPEKYSRIN